MNWPSGSETSTFNLAEWQPALKRQLSPSGGAPVIGVDLGHGRAWSSAVACWNNFRLEAIAFAPGIPDIAEQEKRDNTKGIYTKLAQTKRLKFCDRKRVPEIKPFLDYIIQAFEKPQIIICDRFKLPELEDARDQLGFHFEIRPRTLLWSETTDDLERTRRAVLDQGLTIEPQSAPLIFHSIGVSRIERDKSGNKKWSRAITIGQGMMLPLL